ncbi:MAG TPA: DUF6152 family protein [Gammaproteobacteria bacterium]
MTQPGGPGLARVLSGVLLVLSTTAHSHHSVAAGYDMSQSIEVTGKIVSMDWINPHAKMMFEVETDSGEVQSWVVWFTSANNLFRRGWRNDDLPVGETVTVNGFPARDGSFDMYGGETILPDGRTLFAGNAPGER